MKHSQQVYKPKNLTELDSILEGSAGTVRYIAGATDLMVQSEDWHHADILIDLNGIHEITQKIEVENNGIRMGAGVNMSDVVSHPLISDNFPMLVEACRQIGSVQIRNRATLGGNIANASPAGDTLPVLAVYQAKVLVGPGNGEDFYRFSLEELLQGPGKTGLTQNQYIAFIYLPFPEHKNRFWYFRKVGMRQAMAISKVTLAVFGWKDGEVITDIRICAGSVSPDIERAKGTENIIRGKILNSTIIEQAGRKILTEIDPIDDIRSTRSYRQHTCQALLTEALTQITGTR